MTELEKLTEQIYKARVKYKPDEIGLLVVSDAPPGRLEQFFYHEDVAIADYYFLGVMEVLLPEAKRNYMLQGRAPQVKRNFLNWLQVQGLYFTELSHRPAGFLKSDLENEIPLFLDKLKNIITRETPIILISQDVYDLLYDKLNLAGYTYVVPVVIPNPTPENQESFQEKFREALEYVQ